MEIFFIEIVLRRLNGNLVVKNQLRIATFIWNVANLFTILRRYEFEDRFAKLFKTSCKCPWETPNFSKSENGQTLWRMMQPKKCEGVDKFTFEILPYDTTVATSEGLQV